MWPDGDRMVTFSLPGAEIPASHPPSVRAFARLDRRRDPGEKHSEIIIELPNVDPKNERDWPRQHGWLKENFEAFYRAFVPGIRRL
jgi:hypothetical protein